MEDHDEGPPELVNTDRLVTQIPDRSTAQLQDLSLTKVPLTIITGLLHSSTEQ